MQFCLDRNVAFILIWNNIINAAYRGNLYGYALELIGTDSIITNNSDCLLVHDSSERLKHVWFTVYWDDY